MATIDPSLVSDPVKKKWVDEISEILHRQLQNTDNIQTSTSLSIFQIPDTITSHKPEAYEPQLLGLGPNHHFRPLPYMKMEQKKLASVKRVLKEYNITDFKTSIVDEVEKIIPLIRSCYDIFLQDDDVSLAWVFAIDGLYLYNILRNCQIIEVQSSDYSSSDKHLNLDPIKRLLAQDLMMEENQIPFTVLQAVHGALNKNQDSLTPSMIYQSFSQIHSPLELCSRSELDPRSADNLLHYMYRSIIEESLPMLVLTLVPTPVIPSIVSSVSRPELRSSSLSFNLSNAITKMLPQKEIVKLYEQTITTLETFSRHRISIPSASQLTGDAGFTFQLDEGIKNIRRIEKVLYLPSITLNNDSQVILRNLVAYELLIPYSNDQFPFTEYMGLMCGLILKVDDVRLLRVNNIIKGGELGDNEIVKLFVGMSSSILMKKTHVKSELQRMMEEVNEDYRNTSISKLRVKVSFAIEKLARWSLVVLTAIGSFVGGSWKFVAFFISVATVFMLTYKAYCDVFGCGKTLSSSYASS